MCLGPYTPQGSVPGHVTEWPRERGAKSPGSRLSHGQIWGKSFLLLWSQMPFVHYRRWRLSGSNPGKVPGSLWGLVQMMTRPPTCRVRDAGRGAGPHLSARSNQRASLMHSSTFFPKTKHKAPTPLNHLWTKIFTFAH